MTNVAVLKAVKLTESGDLDFSGGKLNIAENSEAIRTALLTTLRASKKQYFLNQDFGLDREMIQGKKGVDLELITEYKLAILGVQGVIEIPSFTAEIDQERGLQLTFEVKTIFTKENLFLTV